jgi:acetoin utilization deacetylase AcuC-like enzyme
VKIVYSDRHKLHGTDQVCLEGRPFDTYEVPARAEAILNALLATKLGTMTAPVDHGLAPILAVHNAGFVHYLQTAYAQSTAYFGESGPVMAWTFANRHACRKPEGFLGQKGYYAFGWGTPILDGTWEAAYWSAQCALTAADLVRAGEGVAYALCRPPGHHAATDLYGGYCYLNNAAIAARSLLVDGARIAILDVDYHHGNGTQIIFYRDPDLFYGSLHAHPDEEYPYYWGDVDEQGEGPGTGANRNWPLPRGTGDVRYLETLDEVLATIREFGADYLVVSAGFDIVDGDPEGGFRVTDGGLREIGERIAALYLPTVLVQEGGYLLNRLGEHAVAFLRAFAHREWRAT